MTTLAYKEITSANSFTDAAQLEGHFNVSISGNFVATVFVQRSPDNVTWYDVESYTDTAERYGFEPENMWYRIGVKSGGYSSGTIVVRLGREAKDRH